MARSNLNISSLLTEAFLSAQQYSTGTRCIKVCIEGEDLKLAGIVLRDGSSEADFDRLTSGTLKQNEAAILLFSLSDQASDKQNWMLLSFIPDGCKVRDKMLYSSSREDLKRALGPGFFGQDYAANCLTEVKWKLLEEYLTKDHRKSDYLSDKEKMIQEEKVLSHAESVFTKSTAMGVLPFSMTRDLIDKLRNLRNSTEYNLVEMSIVSEEIVCSSNHLTHGLDLANFINVKEPRFIALCILDESLGTKIAYLVFSCPDSAPVRAKMIMSSAKATLLAIAAENGMTFEKTFEIRSPCELEEQLVQESSSQLAHNSSSAAATIMHSKPQRPGRGKSTRAPVKFTADSDA